MSDSIQNLLNDIRVISEKYKEINKRSVNRFNVFQILKMERREVRTHSAFIAELLNPNGSHNMGSLLLKEFIDYIETLDKNSNKSKPQVELETAKVFVEKYTGRISKGGTAGGNIDIYIKSAKGSIIIENKIDAGDQWNQLLRYKDFDEEALLLYLTLDGKDASENSTGDKEADYYETISYKDHILEWLDRCLKLLVNHPYARETVNQYINLLKNMTGQSINEEEIMEVIETVFDTKKNRNLNAFLDLENYRDDILDEIDSKFEKIVFKVFDKVGLEYDKIDNKTHYLTGKKCQGISFKFPEHPKVELRLEFKQKEYNDLIIGFREINHDERTIIAKYKNKNKDVITSSENWPAFECWKGYQWNDLDRKKKLFDGTFKDDFTKKIEDLKGILESAKKEIKA